MRQGYCWPIYGDQHELAFPYATSRAHRHAVEILGEYCGTLISEDYAAYAAYAEERDAVTRASCWAHVRREFVDAEDVEPERVLRPIPMGRKNWLLCWTEVGAKKVGIAQSLISTCILHGIDPKTYLVDVLQRVATHPQREAVDLTPRLWNEKFANQAMPSPALAGRSSGAAQ